MPENIFIQVRRRNDLVDITVNATDIFPLLFDQSAYIDSSGTTVILLDSWQSLCNKIEKAKLQESKNEMVELPL